MQKSKKWWKEHYDNYLLSKLSIAAYSQNNNIKKSTFYSWIKKFRSEDIEEAAICDRKENTVEETKTPKIKWAAVEAIALNNATISEDSGLKITIGKAIIEIDKNIDPLLLDLAVKVLVGNA